MITTDEIKFFRPNPEFPGSKLTNVIRVMAAHGQHGWRRTPADFYMGDDYCSWYWGAHGDCDFETYKRASRVLDRYHRFMNYMESISWENVGDPVNYADNSAEQRQRNVFTGKFRNKMLTSPGGDLCY